MDTNSFQSIYAHASWANAKLFHSAAELTQAQRSHVADDSETIFDLLVHLVDVQRVWLARAQDMVASPLDPAACTTLAALRDVWKTVDDASRQYVADLRADDLVEIVYYTNTKGEAQAYPRWQILLHQALHAAQHRGEAALLLTRLGYSTGWLDYLNLHRRDERNAACAARITRVRRTPAANSKPPMQTRLQLQGGRVV
jgi:uncharacterized damage-inducible protein DinB